MHSIPIQIHRILVQIVYLVLARSKMLSLFGQQAVDGGCWRSPQGFDTINDLPAVTKNGVTRISFFWAQNFWTYDNANVDWIVAHFRIAISISQKIRQFFHIKFLHIELKLKQKLTKEKEHQKHERNKDGSDWRRFKADYERVDELWPVIVDVHEEFPMFSVQSEHGGSTANISSAAFFMLLGSSMWD